MQREIINEERVFADYLDNLSKRFKQGQDFISEDCIRYDFFASMVKIEDLHPSDLVLEYPLNKIINVSSQEEVDCVIEKLSFVSECKFWKKPKMNNPQTRLEGAFFSDVFRLKNINGFHNKWLIVVLYADMFNHLNNQYGVFRGDSVTDIRKEVFETRSSTFLKNVNVDVFSDVKLKRLFLREIDKDFKVAIFKIL